MKIKKETHQKFLILVSRLQNNHDIVKDKMVLSGFELKATGTNSLNGRPIDMTKNYIKKVDRKEPINHLKRLERIYRRRGSEGVFVYLRKYVAPESHNKLRQIVNSL